MMPTNNPFYSRKFVQAGGYPERDREQKESFKEWVAASGNRAIKRKVRGRADGQLAERLKYLRFLAENRNSFMNEVIAVNEGGGPGGDDSSFPMI